MENNDVIAQQNREKYQNILIGLILSVVLITGIKYVSDYYYFDDVQTTITTKEEKLANLRNENQHSIEIKANFQKLEIDSAQIEEDYKKLSPFIPEDEEVQAILNDIYKAAVERNLRVTLFSQSEKILHQGALNEIPCKASILGSNDQLRRYLQDFARSKRILQLHKVKITEEKDPRYAGNVDADIFFSAYSSAKADTTTKPSNTK
jgi:Tfp pilus assembly protein PilO